MNTYIIGSNKGLGKYLNENINSVGINRSNFSEIKPNKENIFVICAQHRSKYPDSDEFYDFYNDNIKLIQQVCEIEHKKIIKNMATTGLEPGASPMKIRRFNE